MLLLIFLIHIGYFGISFEWTVIKDGQCAPERALCSILLHPSLSVDRVGMSSLFSHSAFMVTKKHKNVSISGLACCQSRYTEPNAAEFLLT